MKNLTWNVMYHNVNKDTIEKYNIFNHSSFNKAVEEIFKEFEYSEDKDKFAKRLSVNLLYYFGMKSEWEVILIKKDKKIIITPWVGSRQNPEYDATNDKDFDWFDCYNKNIKRYIKKDKGAKIDVYDQVTYRFEDFVDYCWKNKNERCK